MSYKYKSLPPPTIHHPLESTGPFVNVKWMHYTFYDNKICKYTNYNKGYFEQVTIESDGFYAYGFACCEIISDLLFNLEYKTLTDFLKVVDVNEFRKFLTFYYDADYAIHKLFYNHLRDAHSLFILMSFGINILEFKRFIKLVLKMDFSICESYFGKPLYDVNIIKFSKLILDVIKNINSPLMEAIRNNPIAKIRANRECLKIKYELINNFYLEK